MPWTDITRAEHRRDCPRYPSDLTDEEWTVLHPLVPPPRPGGRPRKTDMREVLNALLYIASGGIPWRMLPKASAVVRSAVTCCPSCGLGLEFAGSLRRQADAAALAGFTSSGSDQPGSGVPEMRTCKGYLLLQKGISFDDERHSRHTIKWRGQFVRELVIADQEIHC